MQFLSAVVLGVFFNSVVYAENNELSENQTAPSFELTQLDGSTFKLSDYHGKRAVYLVFWNTWCTYCIQKIPKLKKFQEDFGDQIKIIAINTSLEDSVEKSRVFQKQYAINYPLAFDHNHVITDKYDVWGTPTEFIIDINGIIKHRDGVPDNLQLFLSQWNTSNCNGEQKTC
jgi:peroxiredoxin